MKMKYNVKQVIVIRKDLNMRKGKMVAQGAHAAVKVLLDNSYYEEFDKSFEPTTTIDHWPALTEWLTSGFAKICVGVDSEEELLSIVEQAGQAALPCALIVDAGRTEFHGIPTKTCCAIGPAYSSEIDKITGSLKLL